MSYDKIIPDNTHLWIRCFVIIFIIILAILISWPLIAKFALWKWNMVI